jgi:hypothetical protein
MHNPDDLPDRSLPVSRLIDILAQLEPSSPVYRHAAGLLDACLPEPARPSPAPAAAPFLTIGMATYDDYDGVYFSVQAIRVYHPEVTAETEILVLDNHPGGPCAAALKKLELQVKGFRYIPYGSSRGTAVRDLLFREARSPFVLAMDAHVLFPPGVLARLMAVLKAHPDTGDLWQGPLLCDDLEGFSSHFNPVWSEGMFGQWAPDERAADVNAPAFEIGMQGLGVFACRRAAWPGFNPRFSGFGGEEGYIHEKFRRRGGRVMCLPFLRWAHRFDRPLGVPHGPTWRERIRNYLIGYAELGLDPRPAEDHFEAFLGAEQARPWIEAARREMASFFHAFDAVYATSPERDAGAWSALDLDARIRFLAVPDAAEWGEVGAVLAHRSILEEAHQQQLESVLAFDPDFAPRTASPDVFGGMDERPVRRLPGAVAYRRDAFGPLLGMLPERPSGIVAWLKTIGGAGIFPSGIEEIWAKRP